MAQLFFCKRGLSKSPQGPGVGAGDSRGSKCLLEELEEEAGRGRWWPGSSANVGTRVSSHAGLGDLRQGPPWVSKQLRSRGLPS